MGIRSLCAAAAVAVGVGQAEAATTVDYDLWLRYEGTDFLGLEYFEPEGEEVYSDVDLYRVDYTSGFTPLEFGDLLIGDIIRFVATVIYPDDPDEWINSYDNGGTAPVCSIGTYDCTNTTLTDPDNNGGIRLAASYGDRDFFGLPELGGTFEYFHFANPYAEGPDGLPYQITADGRYYYTTWDEIAHFTVVPEPAPVPLPATAALLPIGIGALALMRRRRRTLS